MGGQYQGILAGTHEIYLIIPLVLSDMTVNIEVIARLYTCHSLRKMIRQQ